MEGWEGLWGGGGGGGIERGGDKRLLNKYSFICVQRIQILFKARGF